MAWLIALLLGALAAAVGGFAGYAWLLRLGWVAAATGAVWLICSRLSKPERLRPVQMRFIRELFPAMVGYMVLLPVSILLLKHVAMPVSFKVVVVLLPVLQQIGRASCRDSECQYG